MIQPVVYLPLSQSSRRVFCFSPNSRLSVRASLDCDKLEKRQVGGFLFGGNMKLDKIITDIWQRQRNKESRQNHAFRKLYGISLDSYKSILESQGGVCAICGGTNKNGHALSVDHDHETGKVRGLLCRGCNYALGYIGDSVETAKNIIQYLEFSRSHKYHTWHRGMK